MKKILLALLFMLIISAMGATQATPLVLTQFPAAISHPDSTVTIKWTGTTLDSASIFFSRKPGGSDTINYEGKISLKNSSYSDKGLPEKGIQFKPSSISGMGTGIYYLIVASSKTVFSNEIKFIVKSTKSAKMTSPVGIPITNVTPSLNWTAIPDVPYYHVIVTDEKIKINSDNKVEGLSIIWQAITSGNEITYGAPDPSGTITASPPPLSPNVAYSWFVLNNYGNNAALSAFDLTIPSNFTLAVPPMKVPALQSPLSGAKLSYLDYSSTKPLKLKWTNLDPNANTYKVYLYAKSEDTALSAQIAVWDGEVTAGSFTKDTGSIDIDAANILTTNDYWWKVIAVDTRGNGQTSVGGTFNFQGQSGSVKVRTYETIKTATKDVTQNVGLVEVKVDVLDGSMEKPLLFFTDNNGYLKRSRPIGTYRLTAVKDGYKTVTKTVTVSLGDTAQVDLFLERPDASIFGSVVDSNVTDKSKTPVNIAKVSGVSTFGDTIRTETDPSGNFVLNCGKGDWDIFASKNGYLSPLPTRVSVNYGQSKSLSSAIVLTKNSYILSGTVTNSEGNALTAARVILKDEFGVTIGEVPSTNSSGSYNFSANAGTYTIAVTKTGFTSYSETFQFSSSMVKNIGLTPGAAQIKGSIYGKNWSYDGNPTVAAIRDLLITAYDTTTGKQVSSSVTDVWGSFSLSVSGGKKYLLKYGVAGFISKSTISDSISGGATVLFNDTINGLANLYGNITYSANGNAADGVVFSLIDTTVDQTIATGKSDNTGTVEIYKIPDTDNNKVYRIKAAGNNLFTDKITLKNFDGTSVDTSLITVKNGRIVIGTSSVKQILVTVVEGKGSAKWSIKKPFLDTAKSVINVISPVTQKVVEDSVLANIGLDQYRIEVNAIHKSVLDCSRHITSVVASNVITADTVTLPFSHYVADSTELSTANMSLNVTAGESLFKGNITSAEIYYRSFGASEFQRDTVDSIKTGNCFFSIKKVPSGNWIEYYFKISKDNGDVFGYSKELFRTFVKPSQKILTRLELVPSAGTTGFVLPTQGSIKVELRGYYGNKFTPIGVVPGKCVTWKATKTTCESRADSAYATIKGTTVDTGSVTITFDGSSAGLSLADGVASVITIPVITTANPLDSMKIERISTHPSNVVLNSETAQFATTGWDKNGTRVQISPIWHLYPADTNIAGKIDEKGIYKPKAGFTGRIQIIATVDSVRDQFMLASEVGKNALTGMLVGSAIQAGNDSLKLVDGTDCSIAIPNNAVVAGGTAIITIDHPDYDNIVYKKGSQAGVSVASDIFKINNQGSKFATDSVVVGTSTKVSRESLVETSLLIPEKYRQFIDGTGSRFTLGVWNEDSLKWQSAWDKKSASRATTKVEDTLPAMFNTLKWDATKGAYSISVGNELNTKSVAQLAILYKGDDNLEGSFDVSPNPFSPYVAPIKDYYTSSIVGMNGDIKGTCLKIIPMNTTGVNKPDITVDIYTANRTLVWEAKLNSALPGRTYYLFWDGKTRIGRGELIQTDDNKVIYPSGDEMCLNGRYFAVVTIDDGNEKKRFTKEIVLFK